MIKVLIADDSALMRKTLKRILEADPEIEVIGGARDGEDVVVKARELMPDLITMDVNMPKQDGITALQHIVSEKICPVIMVSSLTQAGAMTTFEALELGAFDFVGKPGGTVSADMGEVAKELVGKIKAAVKGGSSKRSVTERLARPTRSTERNTVRSVRKHSMKAVAMGISTGGPKMIYEVLPYIPRDVNAAFFLVQHMPANFSTPYIKRLSESCQLDVVEAQAGTKIEPGKCYVGGGGRHLNLVNSAAGVPIIRLASRPEHLFIPSVSVMMDSVLSIYGNRTIGVIMTGMGSDGADSMVKIKQAGGITIAEAEESAIVFGMPGEAIKRGGAQIVAPIWNIADEIIRAIER
ncbi:MAG TPA: chemotaxis-specific protein-glutamate methyltransferase CheB [Syntrophomonadaceae bacterium]|nr:chemotaxis-specific protein-glutamate methyltransferase CheB [Syntrophomonadaceae bacterium]